MPATANKPGRRNYGPRATSTVRYPQAYQPILERLAEEAGIPLSSWLALAVSKQAGLEIPDYVQDELKKAEHERAIRATEQELELPRSA